MHSDSMYQYHYLFLIQSLLFIIILPLLSLPLVTSFQTSRNYRRQSVCYLAKADNVHLLSLQWTGENLAFSKPVKDVWRWKDSVLGDGRDFFVPKPKTLTALNRLLTTSCSSVEECSVVSNCARFEIIVWGQENTTTIQEQVSHCLAAQVLSYQKRPFPILQDQLSRLDSPRLIDSDAVFCNDEGIVNDIATHWTCLTGIEAVCHHLCLVAAGMAIRPNRPDKKVPFRPFASRDAHILLQLKRTPTEGSRVKLLLDAALSSGKAARDPNQVPELKPLRDYGTGNSKYSIDPPAALTDAAAQAALRLAIEPTVQDCLERLNAMSMSDVIARLRQETELLAQTDEETRWLRKELHQPTMDLRQGSEIDIDSFVKELEARLTQQRQR